MLLFKDWNHHIGNMWNNISYNFNNSDFYTTGRIQNNSYGLASPTGSKNNFSHKFMYDYFDIIVLDIWSLEGKNKKD